MAHAPATPGRIGQTPRARRLRALHELGESTWRLAAEARLWLSPRHEGEAFSFDQRDQNKRKTISQVKLEQELALKAVEEEEAYRVRFKANPLPRATLQPR